MDHFLHHHFPAEDRVQGDRPWAYRWPSRSLYGVLVVVALAGRLSISRLRLLLLSVFVACATLGLMASGETFSIPSFLLLLTVYLPFVCPVGNQPGGVGAIRQLVSGHDGRAAGMVFIQVIWQLGFHGRALSIEPLLPKFLTMAGFMYEAPLHWGQPFMRPNGFFHAGAVIHLLVLRMRAGDRSHGVPARLAHGVVRGGPGGVDRRDRLVLVAVAAPFVLARQQPAVIGSAVALCILAGGAVAATGAADSLLSRITELGDVNSSGFGRLIGPLVQLQY